MSQHDIFIILKELGGEATSGEIKELAQKKFPTRTLHQYVANRLNKLEKKGYVKKLSGGGRRTGGTWKIIDYSFE